jgi:phosphoribosylformimino-5-aminoimidazole carboxamide ribonucleotide (ProFAR) isomerase
VLIPCIDLQNGVAVQLVHGRKKALEVEDSIGLLEKFRRHKWLHIIDLDAAMGKQPHAELSRKLCTAAKREYGMRVRIGGGIRSALRARDILSWKPDQIIVGSAAFRGDKLNVRFLTQLAKIGGRKRIVIALDTARGRITVHGWRVRLGLKAENVIPRLEKYCGGFLCTDVDREGTMSGVNLEWFRGLRRLTRLPIIAAGGIKSRSEVHTLDKIGIDAAVGMALYRNRMR